MARGKQKKKANARLQRQQQKQKILESANTRQQKKSNKSEETQAAQTAAKIEAEAKKERLSAFEKAGEGLSEKEGGTPGQCKHLHCAVPNQLQKTFKTLKGIRPSCVPCLTHQASRKGRKKGKGGGGKQVSSGTVWICLSCGGLGCGRLANQHALRHFQTNRRHALTINIDSLECWCYACDKEIRIPEPPSPKKKDQEEETVEGQVAQKLLCEVFANLNLSYVPQKDVATTKDEGDEGEDDEDEDGEKAIQKRFRPLKKCFDLVEEYLMQGSQYASSSSSNYATSSKGGKKEVYYPAVTAAEVCEAMTDSFLTGGIRGLTNVGNTCFFNSVLQNLVHTDPLVRHLVLQKHDQPFPLGEGNITLAMRHFLTSMWFRKGEVKTTQSLNPSKVLGAVGQIEQRFRKRNQQDANELFVCLVNGLRDEEVKRIKKEKKESGEGEEEEERVDGYIEPPPTFVDEIFGGELHSICTCLKCDRESITNEKFLQVSVEIPPKFLPKPPKMVPVQPKRGRRKQQKYQQQQQQQQKKPDPTPPPPPPPQYDLIDHRGEMDKESQEQANKRATLLGCFRHFSDPELLDGDDAFYCENCFDEHGTVPGSKQYVFHRLPRILCVNIKRFTPFQKLNTPVEFLPDIDLAPFVRDEEAKKDAIYRIFGVVSHSGSMGGGHYIAYTNALRQPHGQGSDRGRWYYSSDGQISNANFGTVLTSQAYMLFFERVQLGDVKKEEEEKGKEKEEEGEDKGEEEGGDKGEEKEEKEENEREEKLDEEKRTGVEESAEEQT